MNICCVCGARPNFMKIAAVIRAMKPHPVLVPFVVHTGQHYDECMSKVFLQDLGLPPPDVDLGVGSASHAVQTAEIMKRFEPLPRAERAKIRFIHLNHTNPGLRPDSAAHQRVEQAGFRVAAIGERIEL